MNNETKSTHLHTSLYQMDTSDIDHNVSHLFEHIVISGFLQHIQQHNLHPSLIGWVDGKSFEERLFIDSGLYQANVDKLFHHYMHHLPECTQEIVDHQLSILESEDRTIMTPVSHDGLMDSLNKLRKREWNQVFDLPTEKQRPVEISTQKKASAFRRIAIDIYTLVDSLTQEERFVFLRAFAFMADLIQDALGEKYSMYKNTSSDIMIRKQHIGFRMEFTLKRGVVTRRKLVEQITDLLHNFPIQKYRSQIQSHFQVFANHNHWNYFPIDYFEETGLSPTPQMIAELATTERVTSLFKKVQVQVVLND